MGMWAIVIVAVAGVSLWWLRRGRTASRKQSIDVGEVSRSWIAQHRADHQDH
jgi:hypothetical protein